MSLLSSLVQNFTSVSHYDDVIDKPLSFSIKVFLAYSLIFATLATIIISNRLVPATYDFVDKISKELAAYYPAELEITIRDGEVSTNVKEPYFILTPQMAGAPWATTTANTSSPLLATTTMGQFRYLLVVDTNITDGQTPYKDAMLTLSKNSLLVKSAPEDTAKVIKLPADTVINKTEIDKFANKSSDWIGLRVFVPLLIGLVFLGLAILMPILNLLYVAGPALVIFLLAIYFKIDLLPKQVYQIALHASIVVSTVYWIINYFMFDISFLPMLNALCITLFGLVIVQHLKIAQNK
ncbi:MAG: hypothetical protein WC797_03050 [Candidatus Paceibacterota bacterium]|jgi:hypothetical protein